MLTDPEPHRSMTVPLITTPERVPQDLPALQRAMIAAANIRAWAEFLLDIGIEPDPTPDDDAVRIRESGR